MVIVVVVVVVGGGGAVVYKTKTKVAVGGKNSSYISIGGSCRCQ